MTSNRWDWETVFNALARQFGTNEAKNSPLTWLYEQDRDCAVLYSPRSKSFRSAPLHFHPGMSEWKPQVYKAILPNIEFVRFESKSNRSRSFFFFRVSDWNAFAKALGLQNPATQS